MNLLLKFLDYITTPKQVEATPENIEKWEKRAPGWVIHCPHCGLEEPFGKYGRRKKGYGKPKSFGKCPQCHKWLWFSIYKKSEYPASLPEN